LPDGFHNLNMLTAKSRLGTPNPDVDDVNSLSR